MVEHDLNLAPVQEDMTGNSSRLYRAAWRWHFYAGLYVIPFFIMLAALNMLREALF